MFTTINSLFPLSLLYSLNRSWLSSRSHWVNVLGNLGLWGFLILDLSPKNTVYLIMQIAHHAFSSGPRCSQGKTKPGFFFCLAKVLTPCCL